MALKTPLDYSLGRVNSTKKRSAAETPEKIDIQEFYLPEDAHKVIQQHSVAGIPPFLKGPYSTMYLTSPWTIRQYAGFSTAEASNAFYRKNLAAGQKRAIRGL